MNYIESMYIEGFKKFSQINITFNEHMNILIGENEAGKSTILEAIRVVFHQMHRNSDKSLLKELFNQDAIASFLEHKSVDTLPHILIEIHLALDAHSQHSQCYWGLNYHNMQGAHEAYGIKFECSIDPELLPSLSTEIAQGHLPYEYYSLKWTTFAGQPYITQRNPLGVISIDISEAEANTSFNHYNKTLFNRKYTDAQRMSAKHSFRTTLDTAIAAIGLEPIDEHRHFGINEKRIPLESVLSVYEDNIPLENKGKGMESLIKTEIALNRTSNNLDVILLEEPENHLCHSSMQKMLKKIESQQQDAQIILTTHNDLITSRLGLNNVLWINQNAVQSFKELDSSVAQFFTKAVDNGLLRFLLSHKAILVEGATEALLLPSLYHQYTGRTIEEDQVSIISCNGISYRNYLTIAEYTTKKTAVITDNDNKQNNIDESASYNSTHPMQNVFMDPCLDNWTWEVCIYNSNTAYIENLIPLQDGAAYLYHGKDVGNRHIGKMLNNKVDTAYSILTDGSSITIPQYVKDAITWLNA